MDAGNGEPWPCRAVLADGIPQLPTVQRNRRRGAGAGILVRPVRAGQDAAAKCCENCAPNRAAVAAPDVQETLLKGGGKPLALAADDARVVASVTSSTGANWYGDEHPPE